MPWYYNIVIMVFLANFTAGCDNFIFLKAPPVFVFGVFVFFVP